MITIAAIPANEGGWASLCLEYDIASCGETAQMAAEACHQAVLDSLQYVAETPGKEMQPPPPEEAVADFLRSARMTANTASIYYLVDTTHKSD